MVGAEAIAKLRRKYPTLQKAWDKYLTIWHLINDEISDMYNGSNIVFYQQCALL